MRLSTAVICTTAAKDMAVSFQKVGQRRSMVIRCCATALVRDGRLGETLRMSVSPLVGANRFRCGSTARRCCAARALAGSSSRMRRPSQGPAWPRDPARLSRAVVGCRLCMCRSCGDDPSAAWALTAPGCRQLGRGCYSPVFEGRRFREFQRNVRGFARHVPAVSLHENDHEAKSNKRRTSWRIGNDYGFARGLTNYGDRDFSLYLRRSFASSMG